MIGRDGRIFEVFEFLKGVFVLFAGENGDNVETALNPWTWTTDLALESRVLLRQLTADLGSCRGLNV